MLQVQQLHQYYGGSHILRDVAFDLPPGKVTVLLGRNGVGKTTLLRTLMGVVSARSGEIRFGGTNLAHAAPHERVRAGIGYVPQGREIFPLLTVKENLETGYAPLKRAERSIPEDIFNLFPVLKTMLGRRGGLSQIMRTASGSTTPLTS